MQGSNNDLVWNNAGVSLAITVLPPWWETWWFRTALALLLAGLIATAHQLRHESAAVDGRKARI